MRNGDYILAKVPTGYPGKTYRNGTWAYEHHIVYWQTYRRLPQPDEVIHHRDGDKHNNSPDNLEIIRRSTHPRQHSCVQMVELWCPACGKTFHRPRRATHLVKGGRFTACSRPCVGRLTGRGNTSATYPGNVVRVYTAKGLT